MYPDIGIVRPRKYSLKPYSTASDGRVISKLAATQAAPDAFRSARRTSIGLGPPPQVWLAGLTLIPLANDHTQQIAAITTFMRKFEASAA